MKILLASQSPRRAEILKTLLPSFTVEAQKIKEITAYKFPSFAVMSLAKKKAEPLEKRPDTLVIAADTMVYRRGKFYGKPVSDSHAVQMLKELSGKTHKVYTGVCLLVDGTYRCFNEVSRVTFKKLTDDEILRYVRSGASRDKAGAYGIQDNVCVKSYKGSYTNILGLPSERLAEELAKLGL